MWSVKWFVLFSILTFKATLVVQKPHANSIKNTENPVEVLDKNVTRSATPTTLVKNDFNETDYKTLHNAKLSREKRSPRVLGDRPRSRKFGRRRPPFLPPRLPPIARRRFPKRPGKIKFPHKPPHGLHPPPNSNYGPPVGFFVMNINNEIVHKSKDLGDIPPKYLDKIIPPSFINDSPPNIYALEHDEGPPLGLGESKEISNGPINSYGQPIPPHQLDANQYYPYPPAPPIELNNVPQSSETRAHAHNQIDYNRGQSETLLDQDQFPPVVYHPPFKKNKKKKQKQHHQEIAWLPDSPMNTYSSYVAPETKRHPAPPNKVSSVINVGQSFAESYSLDSNEQEPPQLPAIYNQNDFKTVNKSNNKKKVIYKVNTSYEDLDEDNDHGLALEYPPPEEEFTEPPSYNYGIRQKKKKKKPPRFDFIDSYEDSSISQEVYYTTPFTVTRPPQKKAKPTSTTTIKTYRPRTTTRDPLFDILDTEDLRNAFQSGRHRYKVDAANKNKSPDNFVLLSSKNPSPNPRNKPASTRTPFLIHSGESAEDFIQSTKDTSKFERPPSSLETDYESYEIAERDFGLRKRDYNHKRKAGRKDGAVARTDKSVEKIVLADANRKEEFVKATTMKPYARFNPVVHFTKTFSSKIEQPRESSLWNGQAIPGNHKIAKRLGT